MPDTANNWLSERREQIEFYISSSDVILMERNRSVQLFLDLFSFNFDRKENLSFLDVGCGDGIISRKIYEKYPNNHFTLWDGSSAMLEKARAGWKGADFSEIHQTFEDYIRTPIGEMRYDFIYSSMAIHHLDIVSKTGLYSKLFHELKFGGLFLNFDVVLPSSEKSERWQFQMWRDWMNETLAKNNFSQNMGKYDDLPLSYKNKPENKPSGLCEQLRILSDTGFRDVDCFLKNGIFVLFGGTKS